MKIKRIAAILILTSCQSIPIGSDNNDAIIRSSLSFKVDGSSFTGTATLPRRAGISRVITYLLPEGAHSLYLRNCHREEVTHSPSKEYKYVYSPVLYLEAYSACPLIATVITQQGNLQHAIIDWTTNEDLGADHYCNGKPKVSAVGSFFCEARVGLVQRVEFSDRAVLAVSQEGCPPLQKDGYAYHYAVGKGFCAYGFKQKGKIHRLLTRGYTEVEK